MAKDGQVHSRDVGLEIALIISRYFLKTEHLHYGYWTDDLPVDVLNLRVAQEKYADFVISHFPPGASTVLDVGCGSGVFAQRLIEEGYQVDCVSPNPFLTRRAREKPRRNNMNIFHQRGETW